MIDCLISGNRGKKYSPNIRLFALKQQYYSTAAYIALKRFFNNNLPAIRTVQRWYSTIDGEPGINISSLKILQEKAEEYFVQNNHKLHLTLIYDEMYIRKQIKWCEHSNSFIGFQTLANLHETDPDSSQLPVAKDALVYLVVGPDFKLPVAYHLLTTLNSFDKTELTLTVIKSIEDVGAIVISLTGDGLYSNITNATNLGAKFKEQKPYFYSPTYPEQKIYIILDPPHMLKLIRKHFSKSKLCHKNQLIDWNLLCILVDRQCSENFNLNNKLTKMHIEWHLKPMNVALAAQTISNSVANTLEQLRKDGYEEFQNSEATSEYLRNFNDAFDILNFAEGDTADGQYKQPISASTVHTIFSFFEKFRNHISEIHTYVNEETTKEVLGSRTQTGFFGFYNNTLSLQGIYEDFVLNGNLNIFYTMQFSQDHLEQFFSLVRNRQGRNTNPSATEFKSAFKKLLVCHPLLTSKGHNVITNATGILLVSSKQKREIPIPSTEVHDIDYIDFNDLILKEEQQMDSYEKHMCAYLALCVEQTIFDSKKPNCSECILILLNTNIKITDELLDMKINQSAEIKQPCESTVNLIVFTNGMLKIITSEQLNDFQVILNTIYQQVDLDQLFNTSNFEGHEYHFPSQNDHKEHFIKNILKTYLTLKSQEIGKRITDEERRAFLKKNKKKTIVENSVENVDEDDNENDT